MTIKAVDMHTMLPRLNEAGRLQQNSEQQGRLGQHAQAVGAQQRAQQASQQVQARPSSGHVENRKEGSGGKKGETGPRQQRKSQGDPEPETRSGRLDVKV